MGAVPKKKVSKARSSRRKAVWMRLDKPNLVECPHCRELMVPHHICRNCGYYRGVAYLEVEEAEA
ncbi:MAG: 50S ribosomal protein L32 [Ardenticatenia bacterium]|nr:MAG: 50S ribosomal protein L32 [Ardenticatenia bacterium]